MKLQPLLNCQFQEWYPKFKDLTFKSRIIKLSKEFVDYLKQDGIQIPKKYQNDIVISGDDKAEEESDYSSEEEKKGDLPNEESSSEGEPFKDYLDAEFKDVEEAISQAVSELDDLFIKLNWSAPRDADGWVPQFKVRKVVEALYLLKASYLINHDLNEWWNGVSDIEKDKIPEIDHYLIMREWLSINHSMEFRCFVKDNRLIAISQRNLEGYYAFLKEIKQTLQQNIFEFFTKNIQDKFPDATYTFDVYVGKAPKYKVWLVDFNVWGEKTVPLLFEWEELESEKIAENLSQKLYDKVEEIDFRIVENQESTRSDGLSQFKVPLELVGEIDEAGLKFEDIISGKRPDLFQN